jgi:hypothetical protein
MKNISSILVCNLANYSYTGIVELITSCKVGDATKSKLRRVAEWTLGTKRALGVSHQQVRSAESLKLSTILTVVWDKVSNCTNPLGTCSCIFT